MNFKRDFLGLFGWLGIFAVCCMADVSMADQARTACILLNGGTIRVLPVGQTTCTPLEGTFQFQQSSRAMEKTLTANINADGTIAQQDQYTDTTGKSVDWIQSVRILGFADGKPGVLRVTFRPGAFTTNTGLKCSITPTTEVVPAARSVFCADESDGGCPTPSHWIAVLTSKSPNGVDADTRNAEYRAEACNFSVLDSLSDNWGYGCSKNSKDFYDRVVYRPGNTLVNLETSDDFRERSSFSLICSGY